MPAKKQAPLLTVAELLGKCQETTGSHSKYARILWEIEAADSDACFKDLIRCLSYLLTVPLVGALFHRIYSISTCLSTSVSANWCRSNNVALLVHSSDTITKDVPGTGDSVSKGVGVILQRPFTARHMYTFNIHHKCPSSQQVSKLLNFPIPQVSKFMFFHEANLKKHVRANIMVELKPSNGIMHK